MAKLTLASLTSSYRSNAALNANFDAIEAAIENTLSRDGTSPNAMAANLDMGSNRVVNLAAPVDDNDAIRKVDVDSGIGPDITTVADNITSVTTVATNISDVTAVSADLAGADTIGDASALLAIAAPGIVAKDTGGSPVGRTITGSTGISVSNGDGGAGNPTISLDAELADIAGITPAAGTFIVGNGSDFVGETGDTALTSLGGGTTGITVFKGTSAGAIRSTLSLVPGTDVLAYDANLQGFVDAFTLPTTDGISGQALTTDGLGTVSWVTPAGGGDLLSSADETVTGDYTFSGAVNLTGQSIYDLAAYADLSAALTAIGSTDADLYINATETLSGNVTVPANVRLVFGPSGQIALGANNLTINGRIESQYKRQIFDISGAGSVLGSAIVEILYPEWFGGGAGAAAADNVSAVNACISILNNSSHSARLVFGEGSYDFNAGLDAITDSARITGVNSNSTRLRITSATGDFWTVDQLESVVFEHIKFTSTVTRTADAFVVLTYSAVSGTGGWNVETKFLNCTFAQHYIGLDCQEGAQWACENTYFAGTRFIGIKIANADQIDTGPNVIHGCTFDTANNSGTYAIYQTEAGGLRLSNTKFLNHEYQYYMDISDGSATSILVITGCSFEIAATSALSFNRSSGTGTFETVIITGCQSALTPQFLEANNAGGWLSGLHIVGNSIRTTNTAIVLNEGANVWISENDFRSSAAVTNCIQLGATYPTNAEIGLNNYTGYTNLVDLNGNTTARVHNEEIAYGELGTGSTSSILRRSDGDTRYARADADNDSLYFSNTGTIWFDDNAGTPRSVLTMNASDVVEIINNSGGDGGIILFKSKTAAGESGRFDGLGRFLVNKTSGSYTVDVGGDINIDTGHSFRIAGSEVLSSSALILDNNGGVQIDDNAGTPRTVLTTNAADVVQLINNTGGNGGAITINTLSGLGESVRIDGAGRFLVGKTSGSYLLDVDGDANVSTGQVYRVNGTQVVGAQQSAISSLTNSTGGTTDGTLAAVTDTSASDQSGPVNDNFAELNAKVDAILSALRTHGLIAT